MLEVLSDYAGRLQKANGRLYLSGLSEDVLRRIEGSGKLRLRGPVDAYEASPIVYESTGRAVADARAWLVGKGGGDA